MRTIARAQLQMIIERVTQPGLDSNWELVNVSLFRLFDDRELRRQQWRLGHFVEDELPPDPSGLHEALQAIQPGNIERWAIVDPFIHVDNDYTPEATPEEFEELLGYYDGNGSFVPTPNLSVLPQYCSSLRSAIGLKSIAFGSNLLLRLSEVPGEWGMDCVASLLTESGDVVGAFRSDQAPVAIVGVVLKTMASDWTHHLANFQVVG